MVVCFIFWSGKNSLGGFFLEKQNSNDLNWKIKWLFWLFVLPQKRGRRKNKIKLKILYRWREFSGFSSFFAYLIMPKKKNIHIFSVEFLFFRESKNSRNRRVRVMWNWNHISIHTLGNFSRFFFGKTNMLINDDLRESDNKCSCVCRQSALKIKHIYVHSFFFFCHLRRLIHIIVMASRTRQSH